MTVLQLWAIAAPPVAVWLGFLLGRFTREWPRNRP